MSPSHRFIISLIVLLFFSNIVTYSDYTWLYKRRVHSLCGWRLAMIFTLPIHKGSVHPQELPSPTPTFGLWRCPQDCRLSLCCPGRSTPRSSSKSAFMCSSSTYGKGKSSSQQPWETDQATTSDIVTSFDQTLRPLPAGFVNGTFTPEAWSWVKAQKIQRIYYMTNNLISVVMMIIPI